LLIKQDVVAVGRLAEDSKTTVRASVAVRVTYVNSAAASKRGRWWRRWAGQWGRTRGVELARDADRHQATSQLLLVAFVRRRSPTAHRAVVW